MSDLPDAVRAGIEPFVGSSPRSAALTGGEVNHAALVEGDGERLVVKWQPGAPPDLFAAEADGLERLAATQTLRVPDVIAFDDSSDPPWLALEYLERLPPSDPHAFGDRFGELLAALHRDSPAPAQRFGLPRNNYLGAQPQINTPSPSWPLFYRDCRLLPQIDRARRLTMLNPERERWLQRICSEIEALMADFAPTPVLIHGDLWSGNFLSIGNEPAVIDPAVYYADREVEMAYVDLFGGFPSEFRPAYQFTFPLDPGYGRRRPLHQIYPLLIHVNHFGETYGPRLDEACRMTFGDKN